MVELPVSFYSLFPASAALAERVSATEWFSPLCPFCGEGTDRFHMFAAKPGHGDRYWCRACRKSGYADKAKPLSPGELAKIAAEREAKRQQELREQAERIARLQEDAYWRGYHDAMRDLGRQAWQGRGLSNEAQDYFALGYTRLPQDDALTIPFHNAAWDVETVQYRLLHADRRGKYRFEKGYPATPFYTATPDDYPFIVVEGAIKAMVLWWNLCLQADVRYNVVAVPSKTPGGALLERLGGEVGDAKTYLMLDPDASREDALRAGNFFKNVRYVTMPGKVDDIILEGFPATDLERLYIRQGTLEPL
jgi:hypothetical protein